MVDIFQKKKVIVVILIIFLMTVASLVGYYIGNQPSTIEKNQNKVLKSTSFVPNIIIPDDFPTIQEGIDHASSGDNILVRSGVYKEHIVVDKERICLKGENKFNTIIDAGKTKEDAVTISAPNIVVQGFTIMNARNEGEVIWDQSGIRIFSSYVSIKGNIITSNRLGVNVFTTATNLTIANNSFIDDGLLLGNYLSSYKLPKESFLYTIINNTVNGKPLYYYKNQHDFTVPNDAGQIILANCSNAIIKDMYLTHTDFSIILGFCSNCVIENSMVDQTDGEIILFHSENNMIQNINASNNLHGICLDFESKNNVIQYNTLSYNYAGVSIVSYVGISVKTSPSNNIIRHNKMHDNTIGIDLFHRSNNIISENEIYNNNIGIRIDQTSSSNVIQYNDISKNKIGLLLKDSSNGNTIRFNNFKKNFPITATFTDCSKNNWNYNYWNRPRILPKTINGYNKPRMLPFPWINIDWHPAKKPYKI